MSEKRKDESGAKLDGAAQELEEMQQLDERARRRRIREELKKVAADKPEQLARVIKAWLEQGK